MSVKEGDAAPEFFLMSADGGTVSSLSYLEKRNIVLYFYPKDDTPGCTKEAENFRDAYQEFTDLDTIIVGVSGDGISSHENFRRKYQLPFQLIPDEEAKLAQLYGVWIQKSMFGKSYMGIERSTFLIDKQGKIHKIWHKVKVQGHVSAILEETKKL